MQFCEDKGEKGWSEISQYLVDFFLVIAVHAFVYCNLFHAHVISNFYMILQE